MRYKYIVSGFGALDQYLYALEDSVTYTKLKWKTKVGENSVYASPSLGLDGNIYVGCLDFSFNAYRVEDGERKWRYVTQWCVFSSAALMGDGTIYIGSKDHNLYALEDSLAYYKKKWSYATGQFYDGHLIDSSPAIGSDGTIYFGTDPYGAAGQTPVIADTNFWAVNPDDTLKWTFETGDGVESSPAIGYDGTIYFGSYDGCLYAVSDKGNQEVLKWKFCTNGPIDCSPAVDGDGIIYFGSRDSTLYALYPDGNIRWTYKANGGFESSPTIDANGYLYIGNFDGNLYAFGTGAPDLGVSSIDVPDLVKPEFTYSPAVTLNNYRSTFQNFDVVCLIDTQGYYVYVDTIQVSNLIGGQTIQKSFSPWTVGPDPNAIYTITAYTLIPEDDNTPTDTLLKNISASDDIILIRGDVNSNSELSAADVVYLISYLFRSGPLPVIWETGDVNCDDDISVSDVIYLINYLWRGGPTPC